MKIERLSENSIRCTLNRADLDSRELKISELAYGTEKAKSLFKDMIAQASFECGFEAEDIPLMIEAIPVSADCIVLVITKVEDPNELDTRFSKLAPSDEDKDYIDILDETDEDSVPLAPPTSLIDKISEALDSTDDFVPFLDSLKAKSKKPQTSSDSEQTQNGSNGTMADDEPFRLEKMISFPDFNTAALAVSNTNILYSGDSILYKNNVNSRYYLVLSTESMKPDAFTGLCNILSEYGLREKFSYATRAYVDEHFEVIIRKNAMQILMNV